MPTHRRLTTVEANRNNGKFRKNSLNDDNNTNSNNNDHPRLKEDDEYILQNQPQNHNHTHNLNQHYEINDLNKHNSSSHNNTDHKEHEDYNDDKGRNNVRQLSYCHELSKIPSAMPMVAMTRDAKRIVQTRLDRLKELSQLSETPLSKEQMDEKKRIIRLERNRKAAAKSRRKQKLYVKSLEEKAELMAHHLSILEMENSHLAALLNAKQQAQMLHSTQIPNVVASQYHGVSLPPFQTTNTNNSGIVSNEETTNNLARGSGRNSGEVGSTDSINDNVCDDHYMYGPSPKRRRLNNGSSSTTTTTSNSSSNSHSNSHSHTIQGTSTPQNMAQLHALRMMGYPQYQYRQVAVPPHLLRNHGFSNNHINAATINDKINDMPKIFKIGAMIMDKDKSKNIENVKDNVGQEIDSKSLEVESYSHKNDDISPVASSKESDESLIDHFRLEY